MKLLNRTKGETIAKKVMIREGLWELMIGLLPYKTNNEYIYDYLKWKKFDKNDAMLFKVRGRSSVHMWFMSFPISVFFLDKNMRVIEKARLEPFEIYKPKKEYDCFVEMDGSWVKKIKLNDKLDVR